ncbi:hypothetical protein [Campylobacter jejuni]|uniref:hypothetical protein n=1 Tax=Campylobacter jejuni TaxID=197 RepID=UPI0018769D83|nr:hypothetical protein [Campylobacter jejuni]EKI8267303.1 hypothetical protein [Campylobacter jejuni]EMC4543489.1 hypothetical protein [Campylobacter jejuni]HEB8075296.1 hypothetical protein [Campylobacter jejuni]HEF8274051.1 hypothetical protein [Campylobacter jejuni]
MLKGIIFPNIIKYLEQDLHALGNAFSEEKKNTVRNFFPTSIVVIQLLTKKYIVPYIGSAEDYKRKIEEKILPLNM